MEVEVRLGVEVNRGLDWRWRSVEVGLWVAVCRGGAGIGGLWRWRWRSVEVGLEVS